MFPYVIVRNYVGNYVGDNVGNNVENNVGNNVRSNVWKHVSVVCRDLRPMMNLNAAQVKGHVFWVSCAVQA